MNKQSKTNGGRGIEWTDYTHNPIAGCKHACAWEMPDGTVANCYAEDVATNVAQKAYPQGFEHHYWNPAILDRPLKVKTPSRIFVGSMADVFGHWVPEEQIEAVLDMCRRAPWHTFQMLTKNPVRVQNFDIPDNVWIGASTPPTFMWNKRLTENQQRRMMERTFEALSKVKAKVRWISAEPLAFDFSDLFEKYHGVISWVVIGAASSGPKYFPPRESDVLALLEVADKYGISIFFKGNMKSLPITLTNWREEFPIGANSAQVESLPVDKNPDASPSVEQDISDDKVFNPDDYKPTTMLMLPAPTIEKGLLNDRPALPHPLPADVTKIEMDCFISSEGRYALYNAMGDRVDRYVAKHGLHMYDAATFWLNTDRWKLTMDKPTMKVWVRADHYVPEPPKPRDPILCEDCHHDLGSVEERAANTQSEVIIYVGNGKTPLCGNCFAERNRSQAFDMGMLYDQPELPPAPVPSLDHWWIDEDYRLGFSPRESRAVLTAVDESAIGFSRTAHLYFL